MPFISIQFNLIGLNLDLVISIRDAGLSSGRAPSSALIGT